MAEQEPSPEEQTAPSGAAAEPSARRSRRPLLILVAVVALLAIAYGADLLLSGGSVPRGVVMAGVDVGGLSPAAAEQRLRAEIEPRATRPVDVTVGGVGTQIDPVAAGLSVDWAATVARAAEQPLDPVTRVRSLLSAEEIGVVSTVDRASMDPALTSLGRIVDTPVVEGGVRFDGVTPVAVDPAPGRTLDRDGAVALLSRDWASGRPVALPVIETAPRTTPADVAAAITDVATPAVAAPITVTGERGGTAELTPEVIAAALYFTPAEQGGLAPGLNPGVITDALDDRLADSGQAPVDARLDLATTPPTVVPSRDGRGVDYGATGTELLEVLTALAPRTVTAVYAAAPARVTTAQLQALGQAAVISEFSTGGFAADSGRNIRRAAELVNGTVVVPGETFSLDAATSPRTTANGYVEAGVIQDGRPDRGPGGGVSQLSTTLFNAAYFAGMTDVAHQAHSYFISRYPPGREATISTGAIDMQFRNDTATPVLILTEWTPESITVRLLGTKYVDVQSITGPRTDPTSPGTVTLPPDEECSPSRGTPGFTITDTRRLTDVRTGQVRDDPTTTTVYEPAPRVVCG